MWFFKKKPKKIINSKFQLSEKVSFRYRDELVYGFIYEIKEKDGKVIYDIQVAGQCPWFAYDIPEDTVRPYIPPKFN